MIRMQKRQKKNHFFEQESLREYIIVKCFFKYMFFLRKN